MKLDEESRATYDAIWEESKKQLEEGLSSGQVSAVCVHPLAVESCSCG